LRVFKRIRLPSVISNANAALAPLPLNERGKGTLSAVRGTPASIEGGAAWAGTRGVFA
jgi:hypothetical protein